MEKIKEKVDNKHANNNIKIIEVKKVVDLGLQVSVYIYVYI
jgi:hypothetical protein